MSIIAAASTIHEKNIQHKSRKFQILTLLFLLKLSKMLEFYSNGIFFRSASSCK